MDPTSAPAEVDKEALVNLSAPEKQASSTKTAAYQRKYYLSHADEIRAYNQVYYQIHKEEKLAYFRKYHKTHKDKARVYRQAHKGAKAAYDKAYQLAHKVEIAVRRRQRRARNPSRLAGAKTEYPEAQKSTTPA